MADFSALIAQIEAYVKQNGNNEITGNGLQDILVAMVGAIGGALNDAVSDLESADTTLTNAIGDEEQARAGADSTLGGRITAEEEARQGADTGLQNQINGINGKIPDAASNTNKLADKAFVQGLVDTLTASIEAINDKIPSEASSSNKLADKAFVQALTTALQNALNTLNGKVPAAATSENQLADKAFVQALTAALQNAINAINTNIGNGFVYAGVATPSGTPVSGKVAYLTAQEGTYTNYGGLVVPAGISVIKYDGTDWSQEQVISMETIYRNPLMGLYDCDTSGSTAAKTVTAAGYVLPTNGGAMKVRMANHTTVDNVTLNINGTEAKDLYYKGKAAGINNTWDDGAVLNVIYDSTNDRYLAYNANAGTGDGVFDVSEYTGDDYAKLEDAIADIPVSEQHGGMMMRFVRSSDNKYVQYRLMADTFNTDVANWQGVDDEPTAGSNNLVKSGGVYNEVETVVPYNTASNLDGESYSYKKVFIKQGHNYRVQKTANFTYSSNTQIILRVDKTSTGQLDLILGITASYIDFTADKDYNYLLIYLPTPTTGGVIEVNLIDKDELLFKQALQDSTFASGEIVNELNINSTPAATDSNLVNSKGIFNADDALLMKINNIGNYLLGDNECHSGALINSSNVWVFGSHGKYFIVKVEEGDTVVLTSSQSNNIYAFLSSYIYPSAVNEVPDFCPGYEQRQDDAHSTTTITIPAGCNYLYVLREISGYIYCNGISVNGYQYGSLANEVNNRKNADAEIVDAVNDLRYSVFGKYLNQPTVYEHRYMNGSGAWVDGNYSTYVDVSEFKGERITSSNTVQQYAFLSDIGETSCTFCDGYSRVSGYPDSDTIPNDCKYIYLYLGSNEPSSLPVLTVTGEVVGAINEIKKPRLMAKKESSVLYIYKFVPSLKKYIEYPMYHYTHTYASEEYPSYYDIWRLQYPALCSFDGTNIIREKVLFRSGEAELAINVPSAADSETDVYVGGSSHGFENIITEDGTRKIQMFIDKQIISETGTFELTPVHEVEIYQETELCQAYSNSNPFAKALKHWIWEDNSDYKCTTKVTILRQLAIKQAQFGMMCVFRHENGDTTKPYITNKGVKQNNPFNVYTLEDGWDSLTENRPIMNVDHDCSEIVLYGEEHLGFSMKILNSTIKSNGGMFVSTNNSTYNKIYFDLTGTYTPEVNEVLSATQSWVIQ